MGSYNTSCFASRQTIAEGDPCLVVPIVQRRTFHPVELSFRGQAHSQYGLTMSTCHPNRFWNPVHAFFEADYEDSGEVVLSDTGANRHQLLDFLGQALRHTAQAKEGENLVHDLPYNLEAYLREQQPELWELLQSPERERSQAAVSDEMFEQALCAWGYLWGVAQEQRLFWWDPPALQPLSFAVIHRSAFEALVTLANQQRTYDGRSCEMQAFFGKRLRELLQSAEVAALRAVQGQAFEQVLSRRFRVEDALREALRAVGEIPALRYQGQQEAVEQVAERIAAGVTEEEELLHILEPVLRVRYACSALSELNLHFEPLVYTPGDYSNAIGARYAEFVQGVSAQVTCLRDKA